MTKRFLDTELWPKEWFQNLSLKEKVLLKYVFENCDCAGFLELNLRMISFIIGDTITIDDFKSINSKKEQFEFINDNLIFVKDFILFQNNISSLNDLNPNNNAHKGILKILNKYNYLAPSEPRASPTEAPTDTLTRGTIKVKSKVNVKDNVKSNVKDNDNKPTFNKEFRNKIIEMYKQKAGYNSE